MKKYISIDIGGTAIKYGIICENAEIILKETLRTMRGWNLKRH